MNGNIDWIGKYHVIKFLSRKSWESWYETFLLLSEGKGYKNLLVGNGSTLGVDKIPIQMEYKQALEGWTDHDWKDCKALRVLKKLT